MPNFHASIRPILLIFLLFGQFPLHGILFHDPARWQFRWCSFQTLFCLLLVHAGLLLCYIEYDRLQEIGVNADNLIGPLFYIDVVVIMIFLLMVTRKWPSVIPKWHQTESLPSMQFSAKKGSLRAMRIVVVTLLAIGLTEHMLSISKTVYVKLDEARVCNWNFSNLFEYYARRTYGFLFQRIPYNYVNTALTMVWTVQDVVIIMISAAISRYFTCINARVEIHATVQVQERCTFWTEILSDYTEVCKLLEEVLAIVSPLLVLSCGTNLYLICYQLFHLLDRAEKTVIMVVFTYFSLFFVILRTFLTMYYCSHVQEVAREPLKLCFRIPTSHWCDELERFHHFIRNSSIVVSAMGLFKLTKRTMLTMLGAVITYELVMLHFAQTTANQGIVPKCSSLEFSFEPKEENSA
ncbi:gustatory receptor for sugar taste 64a-like [Anopheles albimanus]|uniref:gustatory receptor for sugar taste 64a-like n=1 Tax=Anopheles albimanus TaxID=7167 RepID=UPI00163F9B2E|nr:gustatory receptor for sugar taste 64a-like [Anopheles albimanus]